MPVLYIRVANHYSLHIFYHEQPCVCICSEKKERKNMLPYQQDGLNDDTIYLLFSYKHEFSMVSMVCLFLTTLNFINKLLFCFSIKKFVCFFFFFFFVLYNFQHCCCRLCIANTPKRNCFHYTTHPHSVVFIHIHIYMHPYIYVYKFVLFLLFHANMKTND